MTCIQLFMMADRVRAEADDAAKEKQPSIIIKNIRLNADSVQGLAWSRLIREYHETWGTTPGHWY